MHFAPLRKNNKYKQITVTFAMLIIISYFIFHTFSGDRGIFVFIKLKNEYNELQNKLDNIRVERLNLEHKVNLLRPESLDLDLLDEQIKSMLSYASENEHVIYLNKEGYNGKSK